MPDPDPIQFVCVGCGALNPAGAEVCNGCGHRFGWKGLELPTNPIQMDLPDSASAPQRFREIRFADDEILPVKRPVTPSRAGEGFLKVLATLLLMFLFTAMLVLVVGLAGVIFLAIACGAGKDGTVVGVGVGLIAIIAVVIASIRVLLRYLSD